MTCSENGRWAYFQGWAYFWETMLVCLYMTNHDVWWTHMLTSHVVCGVQQLMLCPITQICDVDNDGILNDPKLNDIVAWYMYKYLYFLGYVYYEYELNVMTSGTNVTMIGCWHSLTHPHTHTFTPTCTPVHRTCSACVLTAPGMTTSSASPWKPIWRAGLHSMAF